MAIRIMDPDTDPDPYRDIGKTSLGGGMHCPSASSLYVNAVLFANKKLSLVQKYAAEVHTCYLLLRYLTCINSCFILK